MVIFVAGAVATFAAIAFFCTHAATSVVAIVLPVFIAVLSVAIMHAAPPQPPCDPCDTDAFGFTVELETLQDRHGLQLHAIV